MASRKEDSALPSAKTSPKSSPWNQGSNDTASLDSSFHLEDFVKGTSPPTTTSQTSSRNVSPSRATRIPKLANNATSQTNTQPSSPTRIQSPALGRPTQPSAAAIQRALSNAKGEPSKGLSAFSADKQLRPPKLVDGGNDTYTTLRNTSPSPSVNSRRDPVILNKPKDSTSAELAADVTQNRGNKEEGITVDQNGKSTSPTLTNGKPSRGTSGMTRTLETVDEGDHSLSSTEDNDEKTPGVSASDSKLEASKVIGSTMARGREGSPEHGIESLKAKAEEASKSRELLVQANEPNRKKSFSALIPAKVRAHDPSTKVMTVETETVTSIPQTSTNNNAGERSGSTRAEAGGTLRMRPSNETIRPKKEKKKVVRKPPSIIAGGASTKADIFEAKVASAVDEDTSDSDETFVYESNPPEPRHRQYRHHSRTPSATSMQSLADRRGGYRGHLHDSQRGMRVKRSMKFASASAASSSFDSDADQQDQGTVRASRYQPGNSTNQYQHIGLFGRQNGLGSPFEAESPFSQASKVRSANGSGSRQSSRPGTPRLSTPNQGKSTPSTIRANNVAQYEFDPDTADDERAPLVGSLRAQRMRSAQRPGNSQLRHINYYDEPRRGWAGHFTGCFVLFLSILIIIFGTAGLLFATTKPMYGVSIQQIQHVIASEQELMMDLSVIATNPNVIAVTIMDMDVNVFAKSRYVGSDWPVQHLGPAFRPSAAQRRKGSMSRKSTSMHITNSTHGGGGVDEGTDPIEEDPQTMLLGRVFHFDSPLTFDGSPVRRQSQNSSGELRLQRPGNKTEALGSDRWERVLQHPFELIVKGILKYELPLNSKVVTATVGASITVSPTENIGGDS